MSLTRLLSRQPASALLLLTLTLGMAPTGRCQDQAAKAPDPEHPWRHIDQTAYAGSQKCSECHQQYYTDWKQSLHAKMIQPAIATGPDKTIVADFTKPSESRDFGIADVKWVIGSRWKQRFIGEVDGQEVVYPTQWSVKEQTWQPYHAKNDWWYPQYPDWKTRSNFKLCAGCHSTGSDAYLGSWVELNIACESCHGPGKAHSDHPLKENIVNPARLSLERSKDVCFSCHLSGKPPGTEFAWPVGYQPGDVLSDFWEASQPEKGTRTPDLWENGTAHKNRVQGNTFQQSVMAHQGIQCTVCHDAHGSRHQSMTVKSGPSNALCLTCHGPEKKIGPDYRTLSEHTHHGPLSTGSECIECHMSKTGKNSVAGEARNHTFNFVPPSDTLKYGVPNSCNLCHTDKTTEWAADLVKTWYP